MNDNIFMNAENYNLNQAINIQSKTIDHLMNKKEKVKELREDMRDAVVDQPSFLDLYKGVSNKEEYERKRWEYEYIITPLEEIKKEFLKKGIIIKEIKCEWQDIDIQILWVKISTLL